LEDFSQICPENSSVMEIGTKKKKHRTPGTSHAERRTFVIISRWYFLGMGKFADKFVEKIKKSTFYIQCNFSPEILAVK